MSGQRHDDGIDNSVAASPALAPAGLLPEAEGPAACWPYSLWLPVQYALLLLLHGCTAAMA